MDPTGGLGLQGPGADEELALLLIDMIRPLTLINVKKPRFIHELTANDTSKTAEITKKVILLTSTSPKCQCAAE